MLPGKKYKPEDVLSIAWRRKWFIVVPCVLAGVATYFGNHVLHVLPDRFRSDTTILVIPQQVPENYVRPTVTQRLDERLQTIQQEILTRDALEAIIRQYNLYPSEREHYPMLEVVERMRTRDLQLRVLKGDAFTLSFVADEPERAMKVTETLARQFVDKSRRDRSGQAKDTSDFLATQLDEARVKLKEQEDKVADFQRRHAGEMPNDRDGNLQVLQNLQMQVQSIVDSINRDKDRVQVVQRSLADMTDQTTMSAATVVVSDDPSALPPGSAAAQLAAARNALRAVQLKYTDDHPLVKSWKKVISELEAKVQAEALEKPLSPGAVPDRPSTPEGAARLKRVNDAKAELANLNLQIKAKEGTEQRLREQISQYQARVDATPYVEADFISITRDYDTQKRYYDSLLIKQQDAKMAEKLEVNEGGEQFQVVEPANLPVRPFSPNRPLIDLLGAIAGIGLGVGFVTLLEYRDNSIHSEEDATRCLSLPVLALVPVMTTRAERRRARRLRFLLAFCATVVVVAGTAAGLAWKLGWLARLIAR
jgi:polysaccharide chain length determinant protein (PEP-CTERM system associated)